MVKNEQCQGPANGAVTGIALGGGSQVSCPLSRCHQSVVAAITATQHLGVINQVGSRGAINVAEETAVGGGDMCQWSGKCWINGHRCLSAGGRPQLGVVAGLALLG